MADENTEETTGKFATDLSDERTTLKFANDFSDEVKARIKEEAYKRIDTLVEADELSANELGFLAGVSHGSIKSRAKTMISAQEIVVAILDGVRATGGTRKPSADSVKSFLGSLSAEERAAFLAQLQ